MSKFIDLTGQRFGRLVVIGMSDKRGSLEEILWNCLCDCGKEKEINGASLRYLRTTSCGCYNKESLKERSKINEGEAAFNLLYNAYKKNARHRKLIFELKKDFFKKIINKNCFYCGIKPHRKWKGNGNGDCVYNGIDRIDSSKGYTEDNVVPCCSICNYAKRTMSQQEFLEWVERVYKHSIEGKDKND